MKEILKKHEWLFFPVLIIGLVQIVSTFMFIYVNMHVTMDYISYGMFQYSEVQVRTLEVAVYLQLSALIFWLTIFIISLRRDKNVQKCTSKR